jgi:hypothetical protein
LPSHPKISAALKRQVRQRARDLCEYCHTSEKWQYVQFTVDHVLPLSQGGVTALGNLALACFHSNRRKSDHAMAIDPVSAIEVPQFNPRRDIWNEHFIWSPDALMIVGRTPTGRASVAALNFNRAWVVAIRAADQAVGRHPPLDDPIQSAE